MNFKKESIHFVFSARIKQIYPQYTLLSGYIIMLIFNMLWGGGRAILALF